MSGLVSFFNAFLSPSTTSRKSKRRKIISDSKIRYGNDDKYDVTKDEIYAVSLKSLEYNGDKINGDGGSILFDDQIEEDDKSIIDNDIINKDYESELKANESKEKENINDIEEMNENMFFTQDQVEIQEVQTTKVTEQVTPSCNRKIFERDDFIGPKKLKENERMKLKKFIYKRILNEQECSDDDCENVDSSWNMKEVPHISEAVNTANSITEIDFFSKVVHLRDLKFRLISPLQKTCRFSRWNTTMTQEMKDQLILSIQNQGPLFAIYHKSLCIQLEQVELANVDGVQNSQPCNKKYKILIYFYDNHAESLSTSLRDEISGIISLRKIPPKCVLKNHQELYFRSQPLIEHAIGEVSSPYSICVGGKSRFVYSEYESTNPSFLYFDDGVEFSLINTQNISNNMNNCMSNEIEYSGVARECITNTRITSPVEHIQKATQFLSRNGIENTWKENNKEFKTLAELQAYFNDFKKLHNNNNNGRVLDIPTSFNLNAVVLGFAPARRTRRGDFIMSINLIDDTLENFNSESEVESNVPLSNSNTYSNFSLQTISFVIFAKTKEKLPQVIQAGDVICAHRIKIQAFNGKIQLLGKSNFCSLIVIRPKNPDYFPINYSVDINCNERLNPDQWHVKPTSSNSYTFSPSDEMRCFQLWCWGQRRLYEYKTMDLEFTIEKLIPDSNIINKLDNSHKAINGDITVMVTAILPLFEMNRTHFTPVGFLRVWDGTGSSKVDPLPSYVERTTILRCKEDPPRSTLQTIESIVEKLNFLNSQRAGLNNSSNKLVPPLQFHGKVVNVAIWEQSHWNVIKEANLAPGHFVRLRDVNYGRIEMMSHGKSSPIRCLMVHSKSWITLLPNTTFEISNLIFRHQERIEKDNTPATCNIDSVLEKISNLERILDNRTTSRHGMKLTCVAFCVSALKSESFAVRFYISSIPNFDPDNGKCFKSLCRPKKYGSGMKFHFMLTICDYTDELNVFVPNEVAEIFFEITADDLYKKEKNLLHKNKMHQLKLMIRKEIHLEGIVACKKVSNHKFYILESIDLHEEIFTLGL